MPACGASRDPLVNPGWVCDGTNLVALNVKAGPIRLGDGTWVVIRADLLDQLDEIEQELVAEFGTTPYPGGDHAHLTIHRR